MKRVLTAAAALALPLFAYAQGDLGVRVIDGDTIAVDGTHVRLKGLSCSEMKTEKGRQQAAFLQWVMGHYSTLTCELTGERSWNREVGWCNLDGFDIGMIMIIEAGCQPCRKYDTTGKYASFPVTSDVPDYCKE